MQTSFKTGDIVQLRSGGPLMTVEAVEPETLFCVWFDKTDRKVGRFKPETLADKNDFA